MSRSERWNTQNEIKRRFLETSDPINGAGPIVHFENGKKYSDDSEAHIAVVGRTGKGKSQCCSLPFEREILQKGESLIMLDPKGEGYKRNACFIPKDYQVYCIDFRNPRQSPTKWNPVITPYRLYCSKNPDDNDIASSMLSELWNGVYPYDGHSDKFWTDASVNYAKGLTYGLFEKADPEMINLESVAIMMEQSEVRMGIGKTLLSAFYDGLPSSSLAKRNLATYATAPNETRASIHSVAASGLEVFSRSKGLMEMLSEDTLNILELDVNRPFIITIITPDETDVYDSLSGLLISQISQHLICVAQENGGKLPIRVNIILEELGSVGKSIPTLPNLMVASRSRNIRLMLVLQSNAQLVDVYGKSKAETIESCIGITIGFSTNSWETLTEWAQRCGDRQTEYNGKFLKEPLITASQLAAMPTGTALIIVDSQYKFIAHLPFYDEMYDNSGWVPPRHLPVKRKKKAKTFDFESMIKKMNTRSKEEASNNKAPGRNKPEAPWFMFSPPEKSEEEIDLNGLFSPPQKSGEEIDLDGLIESIDARIAELEAEENSNHPQEAKEGQSEDITVQVLSINDNKELAESISLNTGLPVDLILKRLKDHLPIEVFFHNAYEAVKFVQCIEQAGGKASVE